MGFYREIYDFAARAGAFEGYVYQKENIVASSLTRWVDHLVEQYNALPEEVRAEFQDLCDFTLGRAIRSLLPSLGEGHELVKKLKGLTVGTLPSSPDDFQRQRP